MATAMSRLENGNRLHSNKGSHDVLPRSRFKGGEMGEGAEYLEWIEEMHSMDLALHKQGRCEYPCQYCLAEEEEGKDESQH